MNDRNTQALLDWILESPTWDDFRARAQAYKQSRDEYRAQQATVVAKSPWWTLAGLRHLLGGEK